MTETEKIDDLGLCCRARTTEEEVLRAYRELGETLHKTEAGLDELRRNIAEVGRRIERVRAWTGELEKEQRAKE